MILVRVFSVDPYFSPDGDLASGRITFVPRIEAFTSTDGVMTGSALTFTLRRDGRFSGYLQATDDPSGTPLHWTYHVHELINGVVRDYDIDVPVSATGTGIDLQTVAPAVASDGDPTAFVTLTAFEAVAAPLAGGLTGRVLTKASDADYDFVWSPGGGGGGGGAVDSVDGRVGVVTLGDLYDAIGAAAAAQAASQPQDADLSAIAAVATQAYGRALLALVDAAGARAALGLGTAATQPSGAFDAVGAASAAQAAAIAASQPLDADLSLIAALATANFGRSLLTLNDAAAGRSLMGLGTAAVLAAGTAGGVATLDGSGLIPVSQMPPISVSETFVVASQAAMLALTAQQGDVAIRTDLSKSFILSTNNPGVLADWKELLTPTDAVSSVDGRAGSVTLSDLYDAIGAAAAAQAASQPLNAGLTQIAALSTQAFGRSLLTGADAAAVRTLLALGTAATQSSSAFDPSGAAATAQTNAIAASQPVNADLTAISGSGTTTYGRSFLTLANAGAGRTLLGLGTAATQNTGAFDAAGAAAAAQAASQPGNANLSAIVALTPSNDDLLQRKAGTWTNRTPAQVKTDLALVKADIGLSNVDNTSDANKPVSTAQQTAIDLRARPRVLAIASSATPTYNADNFDAVSITALATPITSMTSGLSGATAGAAGAAGASPDFWRITFRIKDAGVAQGIAWGAKFVPRGVTLPTTTVAGKVTTVGCIYDNVLGVYAVVAVAQEA